MTLLIGFIFFGLFCFYLYRVLFKPAEIILTDEGIEVRHKGWNNWNYLSSFRTLLETDRENHVDKEYLIVELKDTTVIKCIISDLDKSREEIIDLIRKSNPGLPYTGHEIR